MIWIGQLATRLFSHHSWYYSLKFLLISVLHLQLIVVDIGIHAAEDYAAKFATLAMIVWALIFPDGSLWFGTLAQVESLWLGSLAQVIYSILGLFFALRRASLFIFSLPVLIHAQFEALAEIKVLIWGILIRVCPNGKATGQETAEDITQGETTDVAVWALVILLAKLVPQAEVPDADI